MPASCSSRFDVPLAEPRDAFRVEVRERRAEVLALAEDRQPGQPGLEALEAQPLEQATLVGDGPSPFLVVVGDVQRVASSSSSASAQTSLTLTIPSSTRTGYVATGSTAGSVSARPRADVDVRAVSWADRDAVVAVEVALAERPVVVRAAVLERVVLAVQVVDADGDRAGVDDLDGARRQLLDRADVELGHALLEVEVARTAPAHSSGSGVPLALCSASFSVDSPSSAHFSRTGVSGMPISSSSSSRGSAATSVALRPCDHLRQHRGRSLRDRAATARELHLVDRVAVLAERDEDRDLVAAERVLSLGLRVGILELPVPARVLVVIEDHFPVHLVEFAHCPRSLWALCRPSTRRSISSGIV